MLWFQVHKPTAKSNILNRVSLISSLALSRPCVDRLLSVSPGVVHGLGGEAAGVQQDDSASLPAESGGGRLVRSLQGAAGPRRVPRRQVIGP